MRMKKTIRDFPVAPTTKRLFAAKCDKRNLTILLPVLILFLLFSGVVLYNERALAKNDDLKCPDLSAMSSAHLKACRWELESVFVLSAKWTEGERAGIDALLDKLVNFTGAGPKSQIDAIKKAIDEVGFAGDDTTVILTYTCFDPNTGNLNRRKFELPSITVGGEGYLWGPKFKDDQDAQKKKKDLIEKYRPKDNCCTVNANGSVSATPTPKPTPTQTLGTTSGNNVPKKDDSKKDKLIQKNEISGVIVLEAKTENGQKINFTLPADMRAGDTISGSVIQENVTSRDTLEGAVIDINGQQHNLRNGMFTFVVPAGAAAVPIILKDSAGREIARQQIPISATLIVDGIATKPVQVAFQRIGQTGQIHEFVKVSDSVEGQPRINFTPLGNTSNPQPAPINIPVVAESPRATFAKIPTNAPTGAGTLTIENNGVKTQSKFNVLAIKLSADKLQLKTNEKTKLHVEVSGMEGLAQDNYQVTLILKNLSPSVVRFSSTSSDTITTKVTPDSQGVAMVNETLTGVNIGAFTIRGLLKAEADDTQCAKEYQACMATVKANKEKAIQACKDAGGTGVADCIAKVESESKKLEDACFKAFEECRKNK